MKRLNKMAASASCAMFAGGGWKALGHCPRGRPAAPGGGPADSPPPGSTNSRRNSVII